MEFETTVQVSHVSTRKQSIYVVVGDREPITMDLSALNKTEITFGRDVGNDIVLTSKVVSRNHGKLVMDGSGCTVIDNGSTNGILHNGTYAQNLPLQGDDFIRIDNAETSLPNGVLILFESADYALKWKGIRIDPTDLFIGLPALDPCCQAVVERTEDHFDLVLLGGGEEIRVNKIPVVSDRTSIHERDVISTPYSRMVFTSSVIYCNLLKEPRLLI